MAKTAKNSEGDSLTGSISKSIKGTFDLDKFKRSKFLDKNVRFKKQEWIPLSEAFTDIISLPGIPHGHITILRGHSDTGKTTAMLEIAINAQKKGILPVLIITELKWSWEHAKTMGFKFNEEVDKSTGEINYTGDFIYVDRGTLRSIEDVAAFIADLLEEQKRGNLPADLCFLWDSIGSVPCELSLKSNKNNNEWNAGAISTQFGNFINQQILLSRKETSQYTNSLVCVNKVWVDKPSTPMEMPKLKNKNGLTMFSDASLVVTFGNVTNAGTSKIKATKNGRDVEFAKRTKVSVDKNHLTGVTTLGKVIATPHGFILDDKKYIDAYKKEHSKEWLSILGSDDFDVVEEDEIKEDIRDLSDFIDNE